MCSLYFKLKIFASFTKSGLLAGSNFATAWVAYRTKNDSKIISRAKVI